MAATPEGRKPVEVKIDIISDEKENNLETLLVNGEADSYHLSPSGKRAVISTFARFDLSSRVSMGRA